MSSPTWNRGWSVHVVIVLSLVIIAWTSPGSATNVNLGYVLPFQNLGGLQRETAFKYAISQVNANESVLANFTLEATIIYTDRDPAKTIRESAILLQNLGVYALFGPSSSGIAEAVQSLVFAFDKLQIADAATSLYLEDRKANPYFMRTIPNDFFLAQAAVSFVSKFNWNEIGVIYPHSRYGKTLVSQFEDLLINAADIDWLTWYPFDDLSIPLNFTNIILDLRASSLEIVFLLMLDSDAAEFFTQAEAFGGLENITMVGDTGVSQETVWQTGVDTIDPALFAAMQGFVGIRPSHDTEKFKEFWDVWHSLNSTLWPGAGPEYGSINIFAPFIYDAVWAFALGLDKAVSVNGGVLPTDPDVLFAAVGNQVFDGITGLVELHDGNRVGGVKYDIVNCVNGMFETVYQWSPPDELVDLNKTILWGRNNGSAPLGILHHVKIAGLFPRNYWIGDCGYLAMNLALDDINNDPVLLPNTYVDQLLLDTQMDRQTVLDGILGFSEERVIGMVGAYDSAMSLTATLIGSMNEFPQVSYASTLEELSNMELYPYFLRVVPSDLWQVRAICDLLEAFEFFNISIVSSADDYASSGAQALDKVLSVRDVEFFVDRNAINAVGEGQEEELFEIFTAAVEAGLRVFVLYCRMEYLPMLFRVAKKAGATGEGFAWIASDTGAEDSTWVTETGEVLEEVKEAMWGIVATRPACGNRSVFQQRWDAQSELNGTWDSYTPFVYDSTLAFAHALHNLSTTDQPLRRTTMLQFLKNVSFHGMTGWVEFDQNGDRCPLYDIVNLRGPSSSSSEMDVVGIWQVQKDEYFDQRNPCQSNPLVDYPKRKLVFDGADGIISFFNDPPIMWPGGTYIAPYPEHVCPIHLYPVSWLAFVLVMNSFVCLLTLSIFMVLSIRFVFRAPWIVLKEFKRSFTQGKRSDGMGKGQKNLFFANTPFMLSVLFGLLLLQMGVFIRACMGIYSNPSTVSVFCHLHFWTFTLATVFLIAPLFAKTLALRSVIRKARKHLKRTHEPYRFDGRVILSHARLANHLLLDVVIAVTLCCVVTMVYTISSRSSMVVLEHTGSECIYACLSAKYFASETVAIAMIFLFLFPFLLNCVSVVSSLRVQFMKGKKPAETKWILNASYNTFFVLNFISPILFLVLERTQFFTLEGVCIALLTLTTIFLLFPSRLAENIGQRKRARERGKEELVKKQLEEMMGNDDTVYELPPPTALEELPEIGVSQRLLQEDEMDNFVDYGIDGKKYYVDELLDDEEDEEVEEPAVEETKADTWELPSYFVQDEQKEEDGENSGPKPLIFNVATGERFKEFDVNAPQ